MNVVDSIATVSHVASEEAKSLNPSITSSTYIREYSESGLQDDDTLEIGMLLVSLTTCFGLALLVKRLSTGTGKGREYKNQVKLASIF